MKLNVQNDLIKYKNSSYYEENSIDEKIIKLQKQQTNKFIDEILNCNIENWCQKIAPEIIMDGISWKLKIKLKSGEKIEKDDTYELPNEWYNLLKIMEKYLSINLSRFAGEQYTTKIEDFESLFEQTIKSRGEEYFTQNKVIDLRLKNNVYYAKVKGNKEYDVKASIYDNYITDISCTCPYCKNQEDYCKHEYALLKTINQKLINECKNIDYIDKTVEIKIDRPMGSKHPKHGFIYPVNYGYLPNTISSDGEEIDAYVLGIFEPIEKYKGTCIAIIHRTDVDDDKLIIVPKGKTYSNEQIRALTEFQERFFSSTIIKNIQNEA